MIDDMKLTPNPNIETGGNQSLNGENASGTISQNHFQYLRQSQREHELMARVRARQTQIMEEYTRRLEHEVASAFNQNWIFQRD